MSGTGAARVIGILCLILALPCTDASAAAIADGFYVIANAGPAVKTVNGKEIHLGEKFDEKGIRVSWLRSDSNDNEHFSMALEKDGVFSRDYVNTAFCVADYCTTFQGSGSSGYGKVYSIDAWFSSRQGADAYAKFFGTTVNLRAHPGHILLTRFVPAKDSFRPDEALPVRIEIKNVGTKDVSFEVGGQNRGARDNQFGFTAYGLGAVPDTGDPNHFGGLSYTQTLKPGETFKKDVDLRKWFSFSAPGNYRITGTYQLSFYTPEDNARFVIWQDYAAANFELMIRPK
ncbi:MAG TPA: hypothetical protein VK210_03645 [Terriglobia bacterium]|nr:hypothetical protein [Terriglobia bacterium]